MASLLGAFVLLQLVGLGWGLPGSDGWDNDGAAPRDFLVVVSQTFSRGPYDFAYLHLAPVHCLLLAVLTLPVTLFGLAHASSLAPADVVHELTRVPYMTAIAVVARLVSVGMATGIVWAMAKIGEELGGKRAGACVAAACGVNAILTYYAHTTNLEVPSLFWASLALLALVRAVARAEPWRLRTFAALAAVAAGTKDQAAGLFLLTAPLVIALWFRFDAAVRERRRAVLAEVGLALGVGVGAFLLADEVVLNFFGFRARLAFLFGAASQDHALYSADLRGRLAAFRDTLLAFPGYYSWLTAPLVPLGLWLALAEGRGRAKIAALVPVVAALSFTLTVNCIARRTEHRFVLPQMVLASVYAGLALEALAFRLAGLARLAGQAFSSLAVAWSLFLCATVDANFVLDPRYDAEAWLRAHVEPGDVVEVYGKNVYLPRFPEGMHVVRVGPEPPASRSPLPGVLEVADAYANLPARRPRWVLVGEAFAGHYLVDWRDAPASGRIVPKALRDAGLDLDATRLFRGLEQGAFGYARAHTSTWTSRLFPRVDIHASTAREVWIYEDLTPR